MPADQKFVKRYVFRSKMFIQWNNDAHWRSKLYKYQNEQNPLGAEKGKPINSPDTSSNAFTVYQGANETKEEQDATAAHQGAPKIVDTDHNPT